MSHRVLITGASRGIGAATARLFAQEGWDVALNYNQSRAEAEALLAGIVLFIVSYQAISVFIISVLGNLRLGLSIGGGYSVLAFTFSGLTFPIMAMYPVMQYLSKIFPFTYFTEIFIDQAMRGAPAVYSTMPVVCMAAFVVLPILVMPRLKRLATDSKYWGKL